MLISDEYRDMNRRLHAAGDYGASGERWAETVRGVHQKMGGGTILDYGCGQRTLEKGLGLPIANYDPCIAGLDAPPEPADLVVCTDVLEHVEPEMLPEVLDDLRRVTRRIGFFVIANRPAAKVLPDGRNAHLIQEGPRWWLPRLCERFEPTQLSTFKGGTEFLVLVRAVA
jgi:hypothetical protein